MFLGDQRLMKISHMIPLTTTTNNKKKKNKLENLLAKSLLITLIERFNYLFSPPFFLKQTNFFASSESIKQRGIRDIDQVTN